MSKKQYILVIDAGTSVNRVSLFDIEKGIIALEREDLQPIHPKKGWVEQNGMNIWGNLVGLMQNIIAQNNIQAGEIISISVTNQRESVILWDKETGQPLYNAILWQDQRTNDICNQLAADTATASYVHETTGLIINPFFSATKIRWILDNVENARKKCEEDRVLGGTIDSWIVWQLTGRKVHVTDYSNASRTMLFDIQELNWDTKLLHIFGIPPQILAQPRPSCEIYGHTNLSSFGTERIPISCIIADQQASLFGQRCFEYGSVKSTYGTGSFVLMNIGNNPMFSKKGILTTIAWGIKQEVTYALEGSIFVTGSAIQWLRDELRLIHNPRDSEYYSSLVEDNDGVFMVPAFSGLGAPFWQQEVTGMITGITRGTTINHIIRATLESTCYRTRDVTDIMEEDLETNIHALKLDGGASENNFLMQFQSDILGIPIIRPKELETTTIGAGLLAAIGIGLIKDISKIPTPYDIDHTFSPTMNMEKREAVYNNWKQALKLVLSAGKND